MKVDFEGGAVSSDDGLWAVREVDHKLALKAAAARVMRNPRSADRIDHRTLSMLRQRAYGLFAD
ncbi:MAG: transposase [Opitutales bacterium]